MNLDGNLNNNLHLQDTIHKNDINAKDNNFKPKAKIIYKNINKNINNNQNFNFKPLANFMIKSKPMMISKNNSNIKMNNMKKFEEKENNKNIIISDNTSNQLKNNFNYISKGINTNMNNDHFTNDIKNNNKNIPFIKFNLV